MNLQNIDNIWIVNPNKANTILQTQNTFVDKNILIRGTKSVQTLSNAEDYEFGLDLPTKGQLITMDLGNGSQQYRVLKQNGNIAEVLAMYDANTSIAFDSSDTSTYANKTLDTYLNTTFYNTLSTNAKSAIVDKNLIQYQYSSNNSVYDENTHASDADYSTKSVKATVGNRHIYALDVEDVEEYFNDEFSISDIRTLFWNTSIQPENTNYLWLRSANANMSYRAWHVSNYHGLVSFDAIMPCAVRPVFQIDLSKISWSIIPSMPDKGQIITMNLDGTDKEYLVLKTDSNVAEVLARESVNSGIIFNSDESNIYSGGELDTYLNTTYYNILSADVKSAIVDKNLIQYQYPFDEFVYDENAHASYADYSSKSVKATVGNRHIYAPGIEDIEEYFNNEFSTSDIQEMFNTTDELIWLSSAITDSSDGAWSVEYYDGDLGGSYVHSPNTIFPAFQIDLSKISWS